MKKNNPVNWFEIYVNDMQRAQQFYETVFQVKLTELPNVSNHDDMQYLTFPSSLESFGTSGALVKVKEVKAGGNSIIIYFHCEDCAVEESRVEAAGGKILRPKTAIGEYGFVSLIYDTEGNMIGLQSMK
jgi:Predicted enzyme related to lactoylglutathione lyase